MGLKNELWANEPASYIDTNPTKFSNSETRIKRNNTPKVSTASKNHKFRDRLSAVPNFRLHLQKCMSDRLRTLKTCSQTFRDHEISTLAKQAWAVDKMTKMVAKLTLVGCLMTIITPSVTASPSPRKMSTNPLPPTLEIIRSNEPKSGSLNFLTETSRSAAFPSPELQKTAPLRVKRSSKSGSHKCIKRKQTDHVTLVHFSRWLTKRTNSSSTTTPMFNPSGVQLRGLMEHELALIANFDDESGAQHALSTILDTKSGSNSGSKLTFPKEVTPIGNNVRPLLAGHKMCDSAPGSTKTGSANVMERSLCPWYWEMNFDPTRIPTMLPEAKCRCKKARTAANDEKKYDCHEAKIELRVMKFDPTCGGYKPSTVDIAVACVASAPHGIVLDKTNKRRHGSTEGETGDTDIHT